MRPDAALLTSLFILLLPSCSGLGFTATAARTASLRRTSLAQALPPHLARPTKAPTMSTRSFGQAVYHAVGRSAREVTAGAVAVVLVAKRDSMTCLWVVGGILNAISSKLLKRLFDQARPAGARSSDPGMPSSHAQSLFFLSTFVGCWTYSSWTAAPLTVRALTAMALWSYAWNASAWRVEAGYHTTEQVLVGGFLGLTFAWNWHRICSRRLVAVVDAQMPPSGKLPLAAVLGVLFLGACAVGSIERKVLSWLGKKKRSE